MTRYADLRDEISHIRKVRKPWLRSDSIFIWRPWPTSKRTLGSDFEPVWAWLQGTEPRDVHKVRFPRSFWDNQIENKGCSLLSTFDRILIIERTIFVLAWSNIKRSWTEHGTGEQLSADIHLRKRLIKNFDCCHHHHHDQRALAGRFARTSTRWPAGWARSLTRPRSWSSCRGVILHYILLFRLSKK